MYVTTLPHLTKCYILNLKSHCNNSAEGNGDDKVCYWTEVPNTMWKYKTVGFTSYKMKAKLPKKFQQEKFASSEEDEFW